MTERWCWGFLAAAMAASAGLTLHLTRGTTFIQDELDWVYDTPQLDLEDAFEPHNGNLIVTVRLLYKALLEAFGTGYLPFRLLGIAAILTTAAVFYVVVKRRIGAIPALAPALVLLFFGSSATYAFAPIGFAALASISAALGALLALERGDRVGDATACALTVLSVATFSTGIAFLVGVAISVLIRPDRLRRAWIFAVPLALYVGWYIWSSDSAQAPREFAQPSNILLVPSYAADAIATALAALTGLSYDFSDPDSVAIEFGWGRPLAAVAVVALVLRIRRGDVPSSLWVSLGIAIAAWAMGAVAVLPGLRDPNSSRYVFLGAIVVLLVATDAARSIRFSTAGLAVLFGVCAVSLATNIELVRVHAAAFREYAADARAQFGALELADRATGVELDLGIRVPQGRVLAPPAEPYFGVAARYGSPGMLVSELPGQPEVVREHVDRLLEELYGLHIDRHRSVAGPNGCAAVRSPGGRGPIRFELPPGGATMRARAPGPAPLAVGRFSSAAPIAIGDLPPGRAVALEVPRDASPAPWRASVADASRVEVCPLAAE